jgi:hypothetical protein
LNGQNLAYRLGMSQSGSGFTGAAHVNGWSIFHNPAALAALDSSTLGSTFEVPYFISTLSLTSLVGAHPQSWGTPAWGVVHLHQTNQTETRFTGGYARALGPRLSVGVAANYHYFQTVEREAHPAVFSVDVGVFYRIAERIKAGLHLFNATLTPKNAARSEAMPYGGKVGLAYLAAEGLTFYSDLVLEYPEQASLRMGAEAQLHPRIALRAGFQTYPAAYTAGLSARHRRWTVGMQFFGFQALGPSTSFGLSYGL